MNTNESEVREASEVSSEVVQNDQLSVSSEKENPVVSSDSEASSKMAGGFSLSVFDKYLEEFYNNPDLPCPLVDSNDENGANILHAYCQAHKKRKREKEQKDKAIAAAKARVRKSQQRLAAAQEVEQEVADMMEEVEDAEAEFEKKQMAQMRREERQLKSNLEKALKEGENGKAKQCKTQLRKVRRRVKPVPKVAPTVEVVELSSTPAVQPTPSRAWVARLPRKKTNLAAVAFDQEEDTDVPPATPSSSPRPRRRPSKKAAKQAAKQRSRIREPSESGTDEELVDFLERRVKKKKKAPPPPGAVVPSPIKSPSQTVPQKEMKEHLDVATFNELGDKKAFLYSSRLALRAKNYRTLSLEFIPPTTDGNFSFIAIENFYSEENGYAQHYGDDEITLRGLYLRVWSSTIHKQVMRVIMSWCNPRRISDVIRDMNDIIEDKYPGVKFQDQHVRLVSQYTNAWVYYENVLTNPTGPPLRPVMHSLAYFTEGKFENLLSEKPEFMDPVKYELDSDYKSADDKVAFIIHNSETISEAKQRIRALNPGHLMKPSVVNHINLTMLSKHKHKIKSLDSFKPGYRELDPETLMMMRGDQGRTLWVYGNAGDGKTEWTQAMFPTYKLITEVNDLKSFDCEFHDGIIVDDMRPDTVKSVQDLLCFLNSSTSKTMDTKWSHCTLLEGVGRVCTSNYTPASFINAVVTNIYTNDMRKKIDPEECLDNATKLLRALWRRLIPFEVTEPLYLETAVNHTVKCVMAVVKDPLTGRLTVQDQGSISNLEFQPPARNDEGTDVGSGSGSFAQQVSNRGRRNFRRMFL